MIIAGLRLGAIARTKIRPELGPDWYAIDRRAGGSGQAPIAAGCRFRVWRSVARAGNLEPSPDSGSVAAFAEGALDCVEDLARTERLVQKAERMGSLRAGRNHRIEQPGQE